MKRNPIEQALEESSAFINRCVVETETVYHTHNFVEIAYVADGCGIHTVNGESYEVQKGHISLINYDIPHKFTAGDRPLVIYNCIFTPGYFDAALNGSRNFFDVANRFLLSNFYTQDFEGYINVAAGSEFIPVQTIFERMLQEYTQRQFGYKDILRGYLIELLVMIFRLQMQTKTEKNQNMIEVLHYINVHYTEPIKVEQLAALVQFSPSQFCRVFKSLTGTTVISYVQALRIEKACSLLKETNKTVMEIAEAVGYSDIKYFYSVFKKITGKTPKNFR